MTNDKLADEIERLAVLSEKAQPGPWKSSDTYDAAYIMAPDIVGKRVNILAGLWPVHAERDTESAERITYATTEFVTELVNWFRANIAALRSERPQSGEMVMVLKDRLPRLVELIDAEIRRSIQYCDEHSHSLHV